MQIQHRRKLKFAFVSGDFGEISAPAHLRLRRCGEITPALSAATGNHPSRNQPCAIYGGTPCHRAHPARFTPPRCSLTRTFTHYHSVCRQQLQPPAASPSSLAPACSRTGCRPGQQWGEIREAPAHRVGGPGLGPDNGVLPASAWVAKRRTGSAIALDSSDQRIAIITPWHRCSSETTAFNRLCIQVESLDDVIRARNNAFTVGSRVAG